MSRFYVTTPIYYVNDVPAHRPRVHDGRRRRAHALAPAVRRRGLLPDRHRRARPEGAAGRRGAGASTPKELVDETAAHVPRRRGTRSTSPTTTSSARPSRATTRRCRSSCRRSTTRATSSSARTKASTACRARRTTPRTSSSTGNCPIHGRPVEHVTEENYFFKLSRYEDRLLEHYAAHPEAVQPESRLQRGARVHPRRPAGLLDEPHVDHVGRAAAVGPEARRVRVGRRAVQLLHRGRLRRPTTRASRSGGRSTTTSSARTSCASTRCTGPRC